MQIIKAEVTPVELKLRHPLRMAGSPSIQAVTAIFVRLETRTGQSAWGCTVAHPDLTGERPEQVVRLCQDFASLAVDLHPTNVEYSLDMLSSRPGITPGVLCAFDLAFYDLLGVVAGMPLYRLLGGFRNRIQTSITIPIGEEDESVEMALRYASQGFRVLKIKGGVDATLDVRRVRAIHAALPDHVLRLDADGGYNLQDALDVARAVEGCVEMFEQPTPPCDMDALRQVKEASPIPILADQCVIGPASALELASHRVVDGLSIKLVSCGGLRNAHQIDVICRAAHMVTMIGCLVEPALLISAGLSMALSSPNVRYGDLDGYLELVDDPSRAGFSLQEGWLVAAEVPGLGYTVNLG